MSKRNQQIRDINGVVLLDKASGFFRSNLSKTLNLRHTPTLSFIYDTAPNTGARIDDLLSKL